MKNKQAQKLQSLRKIVNHICPICGIDFKGIKKAVYCGEPCKQRNKYLKNKLKKNGV